MSLRTRLDDIPLPPTEEEAWEEFAACFDPEKQYERKKELLKHYWKPYCEKTMMTKNFIEKTQKRSPIPIKEAKNFEDIQVPRALDRDERLVNKYERWLKEVIKKERCLPKKMEEIAQAFQQLLQGDIDQIETKNFRPILQRRGNYLIIMSHEFEYFYQLIHFEKADNPNFMRFRAFDSNELRQKFSEVLETNCSFHCDLRIDSPLDNMDLAYKAYVLLLKHRLIGSFKSNWLLCKQYQLDKIC